MAFYTGRTGSLKIEDQEIAKIRDWSIETTVELLSTRTIDSVANTFVPGISGATGSATLMYYRLEEEDVGALLGDFTEILHKIQKVGSGQQGGGVQESDKVEMQLRLSNKNDDTIKFSAYITSATVSTSTGELAVIPINFTVDGPLKQRIATATAANAN